MVVCKHTNITDHQLTGVLPYLTVADGSRFHKFLQEAFHAEDIEVQRDPKTKHIVHAALHLPGVGVIEFSEAHKKHGKKGTTATTASLYFYVKNAKTFLDSAVKAGATLVKPPAQSVYHGHVRASVKDTEGNTWRFVQFDVNSIKHQIAKGKKPAASHSPAASPKKASASPAPASPSHAAHKKGKKASPKKAAGKKAAKH